MSSIQRRRRVISTTKAKMIAFTNFFIVSRGSKVIKLAILLSLFVLAASVMEEPLQTLKDKKDELADKVKEHLPSKEEPMSTLKDGKAAFENQVNEHLPVSSGSSKEESLFQRAERAVKDTFSSAKRQINKGGESVQSGVEDALTSTKGKLQDGQEYMQDTWSKTEAKMNDGQESARSGMEAALTSTKSKLNDGKEYMQDAWSKTAGKLNDGQESVRSGMEAAVTSTKGKVHDGKEYVQSGMKSIIGESADNSDSVLTRMKKTIMDDKSSDESGSSEEKNDDGWFTRNVKDPLQETFATVKRSVQDPVPVDEGKDETMYEHLKKRVTGLFSYKEDKDENGFLPAGDE